MICVELREREGENKGNGDVSRAQVWLIDESVSR